MNRASGIILTDDEDDFDVTRDPCPKCESGPKKRRVHQAFGGRWRVLCDHCGYEFSKGTGEAPEL